MNRDYNRRYEEEPTEMELYHREMIRCMYDIASDIHFFRLLVQVLIILFLLALIFALVGSIWMYFKFAPQLGI